MSNARQLIENIFAETGKSERDSENLANALTRLTGDLYTETERFIFELLQNADDLPNHNKQVEVKFVFLANHLLVLHNGQAFNHSNIDAICSISKSTKSKDLEQTGYKGIGFKSVFSDSECVYISSGDFSFKFDRNYSGHKSIDKTPWQIKPIWVERHQYPQEIQAYSDFFNYPVSTALKVGQEKIGDYKTKIEKLFQDPRIILFLRHVISIKVERLTTSARTDIAITKVKQGDCYKINSNGNITNWIVQDFNFEVSQELRDAMENDRKVPPKLKSVKQSKVSFAAQLDNDQLLAVPNNQSVLFTYLPTNVKDYQFPFLVNADFLTTANRQSIHIDNIWNEFIFSKIGYFIFEWIANLAQNEKYRDFITAIFPSKFRMPQTQTLPLLKQEFNKGFDQAIQKIAFIPTENTKRLLKSGEAIIDETEIIKIVSSQTILSYLQQTSKNFVRGSLRNKDKLKSLKNIEIFTVKTLADFLKKSEEFRKHLKSNPDFNFNFIQHIYKQKLETTDLVSISFILDKDGILQEPKTLYFQISEDEKQSLTFTKIHFLHPAIDRQIQLNKEVYSWAIQSLKINKFSGLSLLRQRIKQNQFKPDSDSLRDSFIKYARFIFKYRKDMTQQELGQLRNLLLLYKANNKFYSVTAEQCHLADFYSQMSVESIADSIGRERFHFILEDYCQDSAQAQEWADFFKSIGVIIPDRLGILRTVVIPMIQAEEVNEDNTIILTLFIFKVYLDHSLNDDDINSLKNLPLKTNNGLKPACQCQILLPKSQSLSVNSFLTNISSLNILSNDYSTPLEKSSQFNRFLINIGVQCLDEIEILKKKIDQFISNPQVINADNAIAIGKEVFSYRAQLTEGEFSKLSNLNLLLKDGKSVAKANFCYLSQLYLPVQNIEYVYQTTDCKYFVSPQYCQGEDIEEWKKFLLKIGVNEKIKFIIEPQKVSIQVYLENKRFALYLGSIRNINKNTTHLSSFIWILHGQYFSNYTYAVQMWTYINQEWKTLKINQRSILWQNEIKLHEVPSYFQFFIQNTPSIPCTDNTCHSPSEGVYSSSLKTVIADCDPVCAIGINPEIEDFFGIKQTLDLKKCLLIIEDIAKKYTTDPTQQLRRLNETLNLLKQCVRQGVTEDERQIAQIWSNNTGNLLAHNDQFVSINQLFYLDPIFNLPPKNNKKLINLPKFILESDELGCLFSIFGIKAISEDDMKVVALNEQQDDLLPNLIKERAIFIGIFLNQSRSEAIEKQICKRVEEATFYKAEKILIKIDKIDYQESIPNQYSELNLSLRYVKRWNIIKNVKIGELLLKLLDMNSIHINSQVLLRLLGDDIEDVKEYLKENNCDLTGIPEKLLLSISEDSEGSTASDSQIRAEEESTISDQSKVRSPDGTGNPDWGIWGEEQARLFYERLGYSVKKENDYLRVGFDFICTKIYPGSKISRIYSEVKTIIYDTPIIRLKESQWECMQSNKRNYYELLIVVHKGKTVIEIIQINPLLTVLNQVLSNLYHQRQTDADYKKDVEVLLGFQQNSTGDSHEILINWQRLFKSVKDSGIKIYPQGISQKLGEM